MIQSRHCVYLEGKKSYSWCTCLLSKTMPFCDGSHHGTGYKSLKFSCLRSGKMDICGCGSTTDAPFCDKRCFNADAQQDVLDQK